LDIAEEKGICPDSQGFLRTPRKRTKKFNSWPTAETK